MWYFWVIVNKAQMMKTVDIWMFVWSEGLKVEIEGKLEE